jgi:tetratricopeptide (TPR) repeat protein
MSDHAAQIRQVLDASRAAFNAGRLDLVAQQLDAVLQVQPQNGEALYGKGMLFLVQGQHQEALHYFSEVLHNDPYNIDCLMRAAESSIHLKEGEQARKYAKRLLKAQPQNAHFQFLLANAQFLSAHYPEALQAVEESLKREPANAGYLALKARAQNKMGHTAQAIETYRLSLRLKPDAQVAAELADLLLHENEPDEAIQTLERTLAILPPEPMHRAMLARTYTEAQMFEKADPIWTSLQDDADSQYTRMRSEIVAGRLRVAEELIRDALQKDPNLTRFYRPLTTIVKVQPSDQSLIDNAERLIKAESNPATKQDLAYALGKAYNDLGDYQKAMAYYDEANRLAYESSAFLQGFDRNSWSAYIDFLIEYFTKQKVQNLTREGLDGSHFLFIVGMVRSGTTLAEQILSCHSQIQEGGEKSFWAEFGSQLIDFQKREFDRLKANQLGAEYLSQTKKGSVYVVDKAPANIYAAAPLICTYQNLKIAHIKRSAVDTILSIWITPFDAGAPFVGNKDNLVFVYKQYLRLVRHWQQVLPEDNYRTFTYEDLTTTPEPAVKSMLDFLGLPLEETCLHPERNARTVRTPSYYQVRQPINTDSQARWKRYEPYLGVFSELVNL